MTEVLVNVLLIVLDFQAPEPLRENGCLPPSACLSITASAVVQAALCFHAGADVACFGAALLSSQTFLHVSLSMLGQSFLRIH
jgi:hypothetical protein